jgi:hypothetical protein
MAPLELLKQAADPLVGSWLASFVGKIINCLPPVAIPDACGKLKGMGVFLLTLAFRGLCDEGVSFTGDSTIPPRCVTCCCCEVLTLLVARTVDFSGSGIGVCFGVVAYGDAVVVRTTL